MKPFFKTCVLLLAVVGVGFVGYQAWSQGHGATNGSITSADDLADYLLTIRSATVFEEGDIDFGDIAEVNVLLLGLDERKEETELVDAHCDAIHLFTLDIEDWTIHITSIPRGTGVYIPGGPYGETEYYIANACAFAGLDYGVEQIEKIVGVKADYVVTVGFSQVYGILRQLDLPTTESLQWLRHRQSYQIGEPQRTANQQTFMKDLIVNHIDRFSSDLTMPLQYVLYTFTDTQMPFSVAHTLLKGYITAGISERPEDITTQLKPHYVTQEIHFDFENYDEQLAALVDFLRPYLPREDLSELTLEQVQSMLQDYLLEQVVNGIDLADIVEKQLWLQIEDDVSREMWQYRVIALYANQLVESGDQEAATQLITNYILEKELLEVYEWEERGKTLLERVIQ